MKKSLSLLTALTATLLSLLAFFTLLSPQWVQAQEVQPEQLSPGKEYAVQGKAKILKKPDLAQVEMAITQQKPSAREAYAACTGVVNEIFDLLEEKGIAQEDYESSSFTVRELTDWGDGNPVVYGYSCEQSIIIKIRELDRVAELVTAVLDAGATNIFYIEYQLEDSQEVYEQALKQAVEDAEDKLADLLTCKDADLSVKPVQVIEIAVEDGSIPYNFFRTADSESAEEIIDGDLPLAPRQVAVTAKVKVIYQSDAAGICSFTVRAGNQKIRKADYASINLGVVAYGDTATQALQANNEVMQKVFASLAANGVASKDYHTGHFNVTPLMNWEASPPVPNGYEAENTLLVRIRDLDKLGVIIADALDAGAERFDSISYELAEPAEAYREALVAAKERSQAKAKVMAEVLGLKPEPQAIAITEQQACGYPLKNEAFVNASQAMQETSSYSFNDVNSEEMVTKAADGAYMSFASQQVEVAAYLEAVYQAK